MSGVGFTVDGFDAVHAGTDEAGFAFVACPSPSLYWRLPLRGCSSRALLRAANGTLWLLGTTGLAWTRAHLAAANARICRQPEAGRAGIAAELAENFFVSSVSLTAPRTLRATDLWHIERISVALLDNTTRRTGPPLGSADEAQRAGTLARQLYARLSRAISALVDTLGTENLMLASQCEFDARIYNWLLRGNRERRRQFARAFPLLLPYATSGYRQADDLHRIVDRGHKLVDRMAALWSVRPGVIRALQQPAARVAPRWLDDPKCLASTLDALPPETWPRDAAAWRRFDRLAEQAMRKLTPLPCESTVALAWLRDGLTGRPRTGNAQAAGERMREGVVRVQQMRDALIELLAGSLHPSRAPKAALSLSAATAVDGFLLKLPPAQQVALADRYRDEVRRSVGSDVLADQIGLLRGARGWPLLPGEHVSADGTRRIVPVCNRQELRRCGEVFGNCLRTSHFDDYARQLLRGSAFYVTLLDARSSEPCSLAELAK